MNTEPSDNNQQSDPIHEETLETEMSEISGFKRFLLFLAIVLVVGGLTWVILKYSVFIPKENARIEREQQQEQQRVEQARIDKEAEDARIEKERLEELARIAAIKLKEENRLKRIQQNSIACDVAIKEKRWKLAGKYIVELKNDQFSPVEVSKYQARIDQGKDEERKMLVKVSDLLEQARKLDTGKYSAEAIKLLDQAIALYPEHPEATRLRSKIDAYHTEFRIPEDVATIAEVLPKLRAGDTIILAKGTYNFSALLHTPVTIKGAGIGETIIECDTTKQSAFVFQPSDKPYKLSDVTVKGTTYQDFNIDRNPLILVKAEVSIENTVIEMSSGHGVAVLSGSLALSNSEIKYNGWDGVSVRGAGANAQITKCKIHTNYDHGVDFWKDATGSISECEIYENTGSGLVVMGKKANVNITQVRSYKNEQCGIAAMEDATVNLARVVTASNVLSGIAIQGKGTRATFGMVISNTNKEAGFYLDPASTIKGHEHTTSEGNTKGNTVRKALEYSIERNAQ